MKKNKAILQIFLYLGILLLINLIAYKVSVRLDFTADKRYTLSKATREVLKNLDDVITITAHFTKELPPQLLKSRKDVEDMLVEYEKRSGGQIVFEFIDPNVSEETEQQAQQEGIGPLMVNVREKDQVKQMRAYMGAVLNMGEKKEVIPVIPPGAGLEYALTTAIKKLVIEDKPKIGFLQGNGEPPMNASAQLLEQLSILYDPEPYSIPDTAEIPLWYKTIVLIDPADTIPEEHFAKLDRYLSKGGSLYIAHNTLDANLNQQFLSSGPDIGVKEWLGKKGITLHNNYVIDASCGSVSVRQQQGPFVFNTAVEFPYFPMISNFAEHPVTEGLESVLLPFTANITHMVQDTAIQISALAYSSEYSGLAPVPAYIDINREWGQKDFKEPNQVVAIAAEGPLGGSGSGRMIVIANGKFAVNGEGQQRQQLNPDNVNLASNAIDWLSDDTGLINLRTKGVTNRPLEQIDETKKNLYKYGNVIVPILFILGVGLYRRHRNQQKKNKWIQGNF
ncbi:MAG: GldG family protein [Cyclobacteriaceae bacterium]|nr:GldG family protein [Cyclobacteriaceae bacterium]